MPAQSEATADRGSDVQRIAALLGGEPVLRRTLLGPLDAHDMLLRGLPGSALNHLIDSLLVMRRTESLERAVGMSLRTYQRRKDVPAKPLNQDQSGRTWKFAEILAKAIEVMGSQEAAEEWLERPAMGLDRRRPLDLMATPAGVEMVETHLMQLEHGVYI